MERNFENIALIGMMGCGKTVVGRALALSLGWRFVDTDALIVSAEGRSIADIFATDGEPTFRTLETAAVEAATSGSDAVIATGGGAVLRPENRDMLWSRCWVVWLTATAAEHVARSAGGARRPLLERDDDRMESVKRLLSERSPLYALADAVQDTSGRSIDEVARGILRAWQARTGPGVSTPDRDLP